MIDRKSLDVLAYLEWLEAEINSLSDTQAIFDGPVALPRARAARGAVRAMQAKAQQQELPGDCAEIHRDWCQVLQLTDGIIGDGLQMLQSGKMTARGTQAIMKKSDKCDALIQGLEEQTREITGRLELQ